MERKKLVSGMRTTGLLHLGHYEGTLKNWVKLQDKYDCFYFAAVWHGFTDKLELDNLPETINAMITDWLSVGIDPEKSTIFRQSSMPQHAELCTILANMTPLGWLERCTTFKDEIRDDEQRSKVSLGKLMYPVLQTADIAIYKGETVPVGKDQLPHLELSREIVRRFNSQINRQILPEPNALLSETPLLPGIDKRKMSKSYNNGIYLRDSSKELKSKIHMMITDPQRVRRNDPGNPEVCTVYEYHKIYSQEKLEEISSGCKTASMGCKDCKGMLFEKLENLLEPIRCEREKIEAKKGYIEQILEAGEAKAAAAADCTINEIRTVMGFINANR